SASHAHVRSHTGDRREEIVLRVSALSVQHEEALGLFPHQQRVISLELVKHRSQAALRHELEEKLDFIFQGTGNNRIRALDHAVALVDSKRGVLTRFENQLLLRANSNRPEVRSEISSPGDLGFLISLRCDWHQPGYFS